ncbi:hypothetical protein IAT38_002401 [Cryptococcus sp. DSM 104549]
MSAFQAVSRLVKGYLPPPVAKPSKFINRSQTRAPHPSVHYVQPKDRIRRWNIRPGDKVRLMVGKPTEKYKNERNTNEGWKVHTVKLVDVTRNRLFLDGVKHLKKTNPIRPHPPNFDKLSDHDKQSYDAQQNYQAELKPVHYSNVQLCVEHDEKGTNSVFATRLKTTEPKWNPYRNRMEWKRLAARLKGTPEAEEQMEAVVIPWAKTEKQRTFPESHPTLDTVNQEAKARTVQTPKIETFGGVVAWPQHINAPPLANNTFSDHYIAGENLVADQACLLDNIMPLYLSEELAPRFAKTKMWKAWRLRREAAELEKKRVGEEAVRAWNKAGRDKKLQVVLEQDSIALDDVHLRKRTAAEVRAAAEMRYELAKAQTQHEVAQQTRAGRIYNVAKGRWEDGPETIKADRKKTRKDRKARKVAKKLVGLKLEEGVNMVVPRAVRKEVKVEGVEGEKVTA